MSLVSTEIGIPPLGLAVPDASWVEQVTPEDIAPFILRGTHRAVAMAYNHQTDYGLQKLSGQSIEELNRPGLVADIHGDVYRARHDHYQKGGVLVRSVCRPVSVARHHRGDHRVLYRAVSTITPMTDISTLAELDDNPEAVVLGEAHYFVRETRSHQDVTIPNALFEPFDGGDLDDLRRLAAAISCGAEIRPYSPSSIFGNIRKIS